MGKIKGSIMIKVKKKKICFTIIVMCIMVLAVGSCVYGAADPPLVNKLTGALKKILEYLKKIAIPAAGVTIATGVLIRKLSFGDEEKMVKGKKVIINGIIGYAIIVCIDLIIKFVETILK